MATVEYGHKESGKIVKDGFFELPEAPEGATVEELAEHYSGDYVFTAMDGTQQTVHFKLTSKDIRDAVRKSVTIDLQGKGRPSSGLNLALWARQGVKDVAKVVATYAGRYAVNGDVDARARVEVLIAERRTEITDAQAEALRRFGFDL